MRFSLALLASALLGDAAVHALVAPPVAELAVHQPVQNTQRDSEHHEELWKRKESGRGGGGGGKGGSSGKSGSSGGTSSSGRGATTSNAGGRTTTGSGPRPAYGGGKYYGGGAGVPYTAGARSPAGIAPALLIGGALAFWPGWWLGAHMYHYNNAYHYYNHSSNQNESRPIICGCGQYSVCSCDENGDKQYLNDLVGNGSYAALNKSLITVAKVDGKDTILINGTLPNGTTAAGGTEDPNPASDSFRLMLQHAAWWPVVATVCAIVLTV
ncbi:hypothetical protein N0V88_003923 [Collariella sp. IMI 366227]|nr:hypothetical protein N0V88_003923 [Collariella sp. IMI 366227]